VTEQLLLVVQRVRWQDGVVVLAVTGELDICTAEQFGQKLAALCVAGHSRIVLDVAGLAFCDARGLDALMRARTRADTHRGWLRLVAAVPRVRRVLALTRLTGVLPVFDTVAHALEQASAPA
jgi:anti-sigma B factor antagonist